MDRARLCVILVCAVMLTACGEKTAGRPSTSDTSETTTTTTAPTATPSGYPLPVGQRKTAPAGDYVDVELNVGDVVMVDVEDGVRTQHDTDVVVLAEITDEGHAFQAVGRGNTVIVWAQPPPPANCGDDEPDCDGRAAPPSIDVTVR